MPGRPKRKSSASAAIDSRKRAAAVEPVIGSDTSDDDDVPPPPPPLGGSLSWRMSPEDSLSDWMIEIVYETSDGNGNVKSKVDTYHVHKCHLAGGSRKSGYFSKLFSNGGRFAETSANKSRIEFNEIAATKFPVLLDYLYSAEKPPAITTENATALSFLSKYFDLPHLRWTVKQFWMNEVTVVGKCDIYYEHAYILKQSKIYRAAIEACRTNILGINVASRLVHVPDASFWVKLVEENIPAPAGQVNVRSRHLSKLIGGFCRWCQPNQETFEKLTNVTALPQIDGKAALFLLDTERLLLAPDDTSLTPLQERCVNAFAASWYDMDSLFKADIIAVFQEQNRRVLSELLVRSLKVAGPQYRIYASYHGYR